MTFYLKLTNQQINELDYLLLNGYASVREHPEWHQLLIYTYTQKAEVEEIWDKFPTIRMCRGLVINDDNNEIIINPMPKFFNEGTKFASKINFFGENTVITEKSDGYLIQIQNTEEFGLIVTSKGSFDSKYAKCAEEWVKNFKLEKDITYICELCKDFPGDEGIIVTKHPNPELVLITMRDREGREYDPSLFEESKQFTLRKRFTSGEALQYLKKEVEGVVVFDRESYNRVKIKTQWFLRMHKLISQCTKKHVYEILKSGRNVLDLPIPDEFLKQMLVWQSEYMDEYNNMLAKIYDELNKTKDLSDKELGLSNNPYKPYLFAIRKDKTKDLVNLIWRSIDG